MEILLPPPKLIVHPLLLAVTVWAGVGVLYSLHYSLILIYGNHELLYTLSLILLPYVTVSLIVFVGKVFFGRARKATPGYSESRMARFEGRLTAAFRIWAALAVLETIVTGGLPLFWIFLASSKGYADYGIPSIHGFVNSILLATATASFALYLQTYDRRHLGYSLFAIGWSILILSRSMALVLLLQYAVLFLRLRTIGFVTLCKLGMGLVGFLFLFGIAGDFRQSNTGQLFTALARPSPDYPEWMPATVLWSYTYTSTPINNLIYTMESVKPEDNWVFPNTASELFPPVLRNVIYSGKTAQTSQGQLVVQNFNASTAFVGPWQDFGVFGIILLSSMSAVLGRFFWSKRNFQGVLIFAVMTQCLILTLFFNNYLALPVLFQNMWFIVFLMPEIKLTATPVLARPST
jgi:hypothetical protein